MADVFISYSRKDLKQVERIAGKLGEAGFSVWWDERLRAGGQFVTTIDTEVRAAKCVLACWSRRACASDWVLAESAKAHDTRKLVQARLEPTELSVPFNILHYEDLFGADGLEGKSWQDLHGSIAALVGGTLPEAKEVRGVALSPSARAARGVAGLTLASMATLGVMAASAASGALPAALMQAGLVGSGALGGAAALFAAQRFASGLAPGG